jgi:L-alanine-DL-glutamate epimerase-like enolase superfamily enzyme
MEYAPGDEDRTTTSAAFRSALVRRGGYFEIPDTPGMGVELTDDYMTVAPPLDRPVGLKGLLREDGSVISGVL